MQTTDLPVAVQDDLNAFYSLDEDARSRVLAAMFAAVHEHQQSNDAAVLEQMSKDIAFTMRMQRSTGYRKLVENGPTEPSEKGRTVSEVIADLRRGA